MNETTTLKFKASGQILKTTLEMPVYASNTINYLNAEFELGDGWTDLDSVRAIWQSKHATVACLLDGDGKCEIPAEVLATVSPVAVNLVGSVEESDVLVERITTFPILGLMVGARSYIFGTETPEATPSLYEQFINDAREQVITEVEATTLDTGYPATVSYSGGVMSFGLPRGATGATGITPDFSIGEVITLDPSFDAEVYLSGTDENPVLNFRIPRGVPGELVVAENALLIDEDGMFYAIIND